MAEDGWGSPKQPKAEAATNGWNTSELAAALPSVDKGQPIKLDETNGTQNGGTHDDDALKEQQAATIEKAKAAGWVGRTPYDYNAYQSNGDANWEGNARTYEWDGETGDIGPELPELELELFGDPKNRTSAGIDFSGIANIVMYQDGVTRIEPIKDFDRAGLHPAMLRNVRLAGYDVPTPIQKYCIPAISQGYDVIAIAQTGSGKTAAYLVPILNKLMGKAKKLAAPRPNPATYRPGLDPPVRAEPLVVIIAPTRELAVQIFNEARKFCYRTMLRPCVVYGGGPMREQVAQLQKGCDILVASPGRLIDFIERPAVLTLRRLRYMVIDEADEMLHSDWETEFTKILTGGEQDEGNVKYMLFSATFPKPIRDIAKTHLAENHVRLRVGRAGSSHTNITQQIVYTLPHEKRNALIDLLYANPPGRIIIFVNSRRTADEIDDFLYNQALPCTAIHSERTQREREASLRAFRRGETPILVASGLSARGLDVRNVQHVINYDLPSMDYGGIEEYTHRIGRTGRIGHRGKATSFYTDRDEPIASVLTRTLLETKQDVPNFLQQYVPEGEALTNLKFEADSDFDEEDAAGAKEGDGGGDAWGGGGEASAWGGGGEAEKPAAAPVEAKPAADNGWGADAGDGW